MPFSTKTTRSPLFFIVIASMVIAMILFSEKIWAYRLHAGIAVALVTLVGMAAYAMYLITSRNSGSFSNWWHDPDSTVKGLPVMVMIVSMVLFVFGVPSAINTLSPPEAPGVITVANAVP